MDDEKLIINEMLDIISKEISDVFDEESSKLLIDRVNVKFEEAQNINNSIQFIITYFKEDKNLSKLKKSIQLLSFLKDNINDFEVINKKRIENPDKKIYVLIWLYLSIENFSEDEFFEYELFEFLEEVFFKYEYLVYLYDFFESTNFLNVLYPDDLWLSDKAIELYIKASKKYPETDRFKTILALVYTERRELTKAFNMVDILLNSLQEESLNYVDTRRYYIGIRAGIYYENNELDKALNDVNYIINSEENIDVWDYSFYYLQRIAINIEMKNLKQADADSLILITAFNIWDIFLAIDDSLPIAIKYIEKYLDKLSKYHTKAFNNKTNEKSFYFNSEIGKIKVVGNDNWTWKDGIDPFFILKLNNKKSLTIKIQDVFNDNIIEDIELLNNKTINTEDKTLIIEWLNSKSLLSEKNIGLKMANYQYISIVWKLLNYENSIEDPWVSI